MDLKAIIDEFPDFPKNGVLFRDFNPVLRNPEAFAFAVDELSKMLPIDDADLFAGIESRGFILASALALKHGKGLITVRKAGKLPGRTARRSYDIEYGSDTLEIQRHAVGMGEHVIICDDLLATGGTAAAAADLVEEAGGRTICLAFLIELSGLGGSRKITKYRHESLVVY